jgi:hypothetical protein
MVQQKKWHSTLSHNTIEEFWNQKNNFKNVAYLIVRFLLAYP